MNDILHTAQQISQEFTTFKRGQRHLRELERVTMPIEYILAATQALGYIGGEHERESVLNKAREMAEQDISFSYAQIDKLLKKEA